MNPAKRHGVGVTIGASSTRRTADEGAQVEDSIRKAWERAEARAVVFPDPCPHCGKSPANGAAVVDTVNHFSACIDCAADVVAAIEVEAEVAYAAAKAGR